MNQEKWSECLKFAGGAPDYACGVPAGEEAYPYVSGKVLDVGSGNGFHANKLRENGLEVHALDFFGEVKEFFYKMDMHDIDFPDCSFDTVFISHTLEHAIAPLLALSEFKRVVKPNGRIVIVYPNPDNSGWFAEKTHVGLVSFSLLDLFFKLLDLQLVEKREIKDSSVLIVLERKE